MKRILNALGKLNRGKRAYAVFLLCATTAIASPAQTFTTLHSFDGTDGGPFPNGLVQATDGNLYGTVGYGGANGGGTIFKITPSGTLTTLYNFCSQSGCTDGAYPDYGEGGGLVQATNGDFYGTAGGGGANCTGTGGCGTVFKITPSGTLTTLYSFCAQSGCTDGAYPNDPLVQGTDGNFYGTAYGGGANGYGTVFKITPSGTLTTLYSFCSQSGCTDGEYPNAGLIQATDGNFYGTMTNGGANNDASTCFFGPGCGTVFKITLGGTLTTLYSFCSQSGCTDGANPFAALVQATDGDFYGTTFGGGAGVYGFSAGTVFKITPSGKLTTLYSFCAQSKCTDGARSYAGLVQATDGNFYGTTSTDGANIFYGTVFKITPSGTLTTLYSFCPQSGCTDGDAPTAALIQDTNGSFYGTTAHGGTSGVGVVFSLSVGLGPFVETQPTSGSVLERVEILGTNLTGATRVTFNGIPTFFIVDSSSLITTWVPLGATSGEVEVTTPHGRLRSNVPFRVQRPRF
jgi:uncharacterized repeat protein (TIGR03803 family)